MLSIIVLTCNQKDYTLRMAASLSPWLESHPDAELIIVDNASCDGTREALLSQQHIPSSRLRYILQSTNLGVAGGRNVGLRTAIGDTILILDNDTEVDPKAIDGMLRHLDENPTCGLCAPALKSPSGELQDSAKPFPGILVKAAHLIGYRLPSESEAMNMQHPFYVIGACQMFRRSLIDEIGLLDDAIFYGPEDADWCMRISATGRTIDYLPQYSIIHHWQRATRRSPFSRLSLLHLRGLIHFYFRHRRVL